MSKLSAASQATDVAPPPLATDGVLIIVVDCSAAAVGKEATFSAGLFDCTSRVTKMW